VVLRGVSDIDEPFAPLTPALSPRKAWGEGAVIPLYGRRFPAHSWSQSRSDVTLRGENADFPFAFLPIFGVFVIEIAPSEFCRAGSTRFIP
jgi:hypothetical protein